MFLILLLILIIPIVNFVYNQNKVSKCEMIVREYEQWLLNKSDEDITELRSELEDVVKQAGYYDVKIPILDNAGYGQLLSATINPFAQFPTRRKDVAGAIMNGLAASKGKFKKRSKYLFNPLNWIELIIFLPKTITSYLGFNIDGKGSKILTVLWWVIGTVLTTIVLNAYSPESNTFIRNLFK